MAKEPKKVRVQTPDVGVVEMNEDTFNLLSDADNRYVIAKSAKTPPEATSEIVMVNSSGETIYTGEQSPSGNVLTGETTAGDEAKITTATNPTTETPTGNTGETTKKE